MIYELKAAKIAEREWSENLQKANLLLESFSGCREAVVYAAGEYGAFFKQILDYQKIKLMWYWDIRADELVEVEGVPVISPFEEITKKPEWVFVCLYDKKERCKVMMELEEKGFEHVVDCVEGDVPRYLHQIACEWNSEYMADQCEVCVFNMECPRYRVALLDKLKKVDNDHKRGYSDYPMLDHCNRVATGITWDCNLRCKGCVYTMPYIRFERKGVCDLEQYLADVKKILQVTEYVRTLSIGAGETLLYQDALLSILQSLVKEPRIFFISIISNGTVLIKHELLQFMRDHKDKILFTIDDYELPSVNIDEFVSSLKENGIRYYVLRNNNNTWYDMRTTGERPVSDAELPSILQSCKYWNLHGFVLSDSYLYPRCCGQEEVAEIMGTLDTSVRVSLKDTPTVELAQRLLSVHNQTYQLEACRACPLRDESVIIPAGEQMTPKEFKQMRDEYYEKKTAHKKA